MNLWIISSDSFRQIMRSTLFLQAISQNWFWFWWLPRLKNSKSIYLS